MIQERRLRLCLLPFKDIVMPKTHFWSNCKILGVFKTESSAKSACDATYDEILKYDGDCFKEHTPNADEYKSLYYHPYTRYSWRIEQYNKIK